ncbi:MAG: RNase adapter RapZ [Clostridia bacterium]|nr:RNase adapter RapZ [Clostridia bacterium]
MRLVIISGMSGAGKSSALRAFEDMGFSCVDNVPPELIGKFSEILSAPNCSIDKMVLVVDSRSAELFSGLLPALEQLDGHHIDFDLLFLDSSNEVLLKRYKETRRRHPLISMADGSLETAIRIERDKMLDARNRADFVIDTTYLSGKELVKRLRQMFSERISSMEVSILSFGYKYGIPADADLVFDVRCLPNPFYIDELRGKRGYDAEVYDYVFKWSVSQEFKNKLEDLIGFLLPLYAEEGKSSIVIAFGCTGGQHRSVAFAEHFSRFCANHRYHTTLTHRDAEK